MRARRPLPRILASRRPMSPSCREDENPTVAWGCPACRTTREVAARSGLGQLVHQHGHRRLLRVLIVQPGRLRGRRPIRAAAGDRDPARAPGEPGCLGVIPEEQITLFSEEADIGDRDGYRSEEVAVGGNFAPIGSYTYDYVVTVEGSLSGEATPPPSSSDPPRGSSRRTPMRICSTRRCSTGSVARLRFTD